MAWTDFWNTIGAFFGFIFKIIRKLYQTPNILVWILLISLLIFWVLQLRKNTKESKRNGTYI